MEEPRRKRSGQEDPCTRVRYRADLQRVGSLDSKCYYIASDGTCLLPEDELKEKCPIRERVGHEDKDESVFGT